MTPEAALVRIKQVLADITSVPETQLDEEDVIPDILTGDSLSFVEYCTALELAFDLDLHEASPDELRTLASTATYVCELLRERDASQR
jgi:acyl carrier protein